MGGFRWKFEVRQLLRRFDLTKRDFHLMPIIAEMENVDEGGLRVIVVGGEIFVSRASGGCCRGDRWSLWELN